MTAPTITPVLYDFDPPPQIAVVQFGGDDTRLAEVGAWVEANKNPGDDVLYVDWMKRIFITPAVGPALDIEFEDYLYLDDDNVFHKLKPAVFTAFFTASSV